MRETHVYRHEGVYVEIVTAPARLATSTHDTSHGASGDSAQSSTTPFSGEFIRLQCGEALESMTEFVVPVEVARCSGLVAQLLDSPMAFQETLSRRVVLPTIEAPALERVLEFAMQDILYNGVQNERRTAFEFGVGPAEVMEVLRACHFLHVAPLLDLACRMLAEYITAIPSFESIPHDALYRIALACKPRQLAIFQASRFSDIQEADDGVNSDLGWQSHEPGDDDDEVGAMSLMHKAIEEGSIWQRVCESSAFSWTELALRAAMPWDSCRSVFGMPPLLLPFLEEIERGSAADWRLIYIHCDVQRLVDRSFLEMLDSGSDDESLLHEYWMAVVPWLRHLVTPPTLWELLQTHEAPLRSPQRPCAGAHSPTRVRDHSSPTRASRPATPRGSARAPRSPAKRAPAVNEAHLRVARKARALFEAAAVAAGEPVASSLGPVALVARALPRLQTLDLSHSVMDAESPLFLDLLAVLRAEPRRWHVLRLNHTRLTNDMALLVCEALCVPRSPLRWLDLSNNCLGGSGLCHVAELLRQSDSQLECLALGEQTPAKPSTDEVSNSDGLAAVIAALAHNHSLRVLMAEQLDASAECALLRDNWPNLRHNTRLEHLSLAGNPHLFSAGWLFQPQFRLRDGLLGLPRNLELLDLAGVRLDNQTVEALPELCASMPRLRSLNLSRCSSNSEAFRCLADVLERSEQLQSLILEGTIGSHGSRVAELCRGLRANRSLTLLDLTSAGLNVHEFEPIVEVLRSRPVHCTLRVAQAHAELEPLRALSDERVTVAMP